MGLEIAAIANTELRRLAFLKDDNKDNFLNKTEFEAFSILAKAQEGVSQVDIKQAMGLYKSESSDENVTLGKKELKQKRKDIKNDIKALIEGEKDARLSVDSRVSLDNLITKLQELNTDSDYQGVIADVEKVVAFVRQEGFDSKRDVKDLEKKIEKNDDFNKFQKDLAKYMVELAKWEQINKETSELVDLYNKVEGNNSTEKLKNVKNQVKDLIKQDKLPKNSYYTDEAFDALKENVAQNISHANDIKRVNMIKEKSENTSGKQVKNALLEGYDKDDKFARKVTKKEKEMNNLVGRWLDRDRRAEDLESVTEKELRKELGDELFEILKRSYLSDKSGRKNPDGTYNLRELSEIVSDRVGYDVQMNSSDDKAMSEMQGIKNEIRFATGRALADKDIEKILDFVHVEKEPKDRNFVRALLNTLVPGIAGAVSSAATYQRLDVNQKVQLNMKASLATSIVDQLQAAGVKPEITTQEDGTMTITVLQKVLKDDRALMALAGAGIGVLTGTLLNLIFGMEKNEKSCISIADFDLNDKKYTDINQYKDYVRKVQPEEKADLIIAVAEAMHAEYGDNWATEYDSMLKKFAGQGSVLNCLEFRGGKLVSVTAKETEAQDNNGQNIGQNNGQNDGQNEGQTQACNAIVSSETTDPIERPEDKTKIHEKQGGDTWKGLVEAYYPGLVEECGTLWGANGAIRALKKALSYNQDGTFNNDTYRKLLSGKDLPDRIKLPSKIGNVERQDGSVKKATFAKAGTGALIKEVGRNDISVTKIPGTTTWKAVDGCDENGAIGYGKSKEDAVKDLERQTNKKYEKIIEQK